MDKKLKFIDLFAGIGGFHLALHSLGCECVFASEIDNYARKTYEHNFKKISPQLFENNMFNDDIRKITAEEIPDFDILCAGFPCQPFSQAGYKRGFEDTHKSERGNLFFNIAEIIKEKKPKAFFLENVRGIVNHNSGKTFKIIREILENELEYKLYFKVIKASDYGLPQLRPRVFIIGFRDEDNKNTFSFPDKVPLKFNMSDVWGGKCSREIGFTIRVGGRGSSIDDRRNWDAYLVDDEVKKLMPTQAKKMQGFPNEFEFLVSTKEAMKQLGNSVAIDAIKICANAMLNHLKLIEKKAVIMDSKKNKGEWTEIYSFLKIIKDKKLILADKKLNTTINSDYFNITKVSTLNIEESVSFGIGDNVIVENKKNGKINKICISNFINAEVLKDLVNEIKSQKGTFNIPKFDIIQDKLGISIIKGGNSNQKADIILDVKNNEFEAKHDGFGIKSYLGSKPTLLNASGNTNFIYEIVGLNAKHIDDIKNITTKDKLKDRINKIIELGGEFKFSKVEKDIMSYNLEMVDTIIPELLSKMLLEFFIKRTASFEKNLSALYNNKKLNCFNGDLTTFQVKSKRFLVAVLLGFFAGKKWDGKYISNGTIVVKDNGEQVGFHIINLPALEDYLYENIKFDTPSTTRHRYGNLIVECNGKMYFKLNLQLRF